MKNYLKLIIVGMLIGVTFPTVIYSQKNTDSEERIDEIFEEFNNTTPGAAIRITQNGKVIYSKGFGISNLEFNTPITDETIFEAGSVSKQFTATSILLLVQDGKLNLDDDVHDYIPELPHYESTITIRHLLNHTSGLRDWGTVAAIGGWPRGSQIYTNKRAFDIILKQEKLNHSPGEYYLYSNSNYTLLTLIVERVSGMSLPSFTNERIFKPIGMNNTSWRDDFKEIVDNRAVGYDKIKNSFKSNMPFENTYGHAALLTNVKDLDKWNRSWENTPLGNNDLLELRLEQGVLNNGEKIIYAAGVRIADHNGFYEVNHSGATAGYRSWMAYYPEESLSIVYLSNATYFPTGVTGKKIANVLLGNDELPSSETESSLQSNYIPELNDLLSIEGTYYSDESGGTYDIFVVDGKVWLDDKINKKIILEPVKKNVFKWGKSTEYAFKLFGYNKHLYVSKPRAKDVKFIKR